jgi:hypothetical protein
MSAVVGRHSSVGIRAARSTVLGDPDRKRPARGEGHDGDAVKAVSCPLLSPVLRRPVFVSVF